MNSINNSNRPVEANIDLASTTAVGCDKCKNESLIQAFHVRRVSPIASGTGKAGLIPIQVFACVACGHVNAEWLPVELRGVSLVV